MTTTAAGTGTTTAAGTDAADDNDDTVAFGGPAPAPAIAPAPAPAIAPAIAPALAPAIAPAIAPGTSRKNDEHEIRRLYAQYHYYHHDSDHVSDDDDDDDDVSFDERDRYYNNDLINKKREKRNADTKAKAAKAKAAKAKDAKAKDAKAKDKKAKDRKDKDKKDETRRIGDHSWRHYFLLVGWLICVLFHAWMVVLWFRQQPGLASSFNGLTIVRGVDLLVVLGLLAGIVSWYFVFDDAGREHDFHNNMVLFIHWSNHDYMSVMLAVSVVIMYFLIYLLGIPMAASSKPISIEFIEFILWFSLLFALLLVSAKHLLRVDIGAHMISYFQQWWRGNGMFPGLRDKDSDSDSDNDSDNDSEETKEKTEEDDDEEKERKEKEKEKEKSNKKEEVFHVAQNLYTYSDAQAVCHAEGARLATYREIEQSYEKGAEWCEYGWSDNQMVFFPTQEATWETLQKSKGNENACGRPGVNGGYQADANKRYGVNCYGVKPEPSEAEKLMLEEQQRGRLGPKSAEQNAIDKKAKFFKEEGKDLVELTSFNQKRWSEY